MPNPTTLNDPPIPLTLPLSVIRVVMAALGKLPLEHAIGAFTAIDQQTSAAIAGYQAKVEGERDIEPVILRRRRGGE